MTETTLPIALTLGQNTYSANLRLRHAVDIGGVGRTTAAALWTCGEAKIMTPSGALTEQCEDREVNNNPFQDPDDRWQQTSFRAESMEFPAAFQLITQLTISKDDGMTPGELSLECFHLNTRYR